MSFNRAFIALMSMLALGATIAVTANASAATPAPVTGTTGATGTSDSESSAPPVTEETPSVETRLRRGPVVLRVADRSVRFGGKFRLWGRTGNPFAGQVRVQAHGPRGWHTLKRQATRAGGGFRTWVPARTSGRLRVRTGDGRVSPVRRVTVIGRVELKRSERYVRLGDSLVIRGSVKPRGARTVKVRIKGAHGITARTRANGRFRVRWTPTTNGDYSYRVRALGNRRSTGDGTRRRKVSALRPGHASYYGPGLYGNGVACGGTLTPSTRGVANKSLPCGTKVTLQYGNRTVVARVIDRGPYVAGRDWDLTEQTKRDLGFGGVGVVWTNK